MPAAKKGDASGHDFSLVLDGRALTEYVMRLGHKKTHMPFPKMLVMGIFAGFYVSFACQGFVSTLAGTTLNGPAKVLSGCIFATSLMLILIVGAELFTSNVLILVAALSKRVHYWEWAYDVVFIFFANFLGCIITGVAFWGAGVNGFETTLNDAGTVLCSLAHKKAELPLYQALLRGIGANMCVCFAALIGYASKSTTGKILGCVFPVALFVAVGFEHAIANQYLFTVATLLNCDEFFQRHAWSELFLAAVGNILGAMILAVGYWYTNIHGTKLVMREVPSAHGAEEEGEESGAFGRVLMSIFPTSGEAITPSTARHIESLAGPSCARVSTYFTGVPNPHGPDNHLAEEKPAADAQHQQTPNDPLHV
mmetsp:Transcript_68340/g.79566  ORF Transcript_68340/g.79566 Transcript_68340/m.79566 type:complete len:367 (-) Transcript_68340:431-1531(-)